MEYQVIQRSNRKSTLVPIVCKSSTPWSSSERVEFRVLGSTGSVEDWTTININQAGDAIQADQILQFGLEVPAGGWYRLEVRRRDAETIIATDCVEHFGVGELFVVAGQSNSANHGEEKQRTQTGRVVAFDGQQWHLANDPQPGASGQGGSFMPPLGDLLSKQWDVPVGFIACGIGATSVREWLPKGSTFPNPPTIESRVKPTAEGNWESDGQAFEALVNRMRPLGRHGFRAVLWHQGESDANQRDPSRTLEGKQYREYLGTIIRQSRQEIQWEAPWFVARVSYHGPSDEGSPDIRDAQASLSNEGLALAGPDSDALKGALRERNGQGIHFSGEGLREHAARWAEKIAPWLEKQLAD